MKSKLILIMVFFLTIKLNAQDNLLDPLLKETLTAVQSTSYFGNSISMSSDGGTLAVGEYNYVGSSTDEKGRVQIFENQSGVWNQKGQDILGIDDLFNAFGNKVELSSDGNTVAILDSQVNFTLSPGQTINDLLGADVVEYFQYVQVFRFISGSWVQIGTDFTFSDVISYEDFSLSKDGNSIAISANDGTKVYEFDGTNWIQVGQEIPELNPLFKELLSISEDGSIVAITDENYNDPNTLANPSTEGQVRVYEDIGGSWIQLGNNIVGSSDFQGLGKRIDISSNGNYIAIVSEEGGSNDTVSVYEINNGTWSLKGTSISQGLSEIFDIELSANGTTLAISDSNGARLFKFDTDWNQVNRTTKEEDGSDFRHSITMADNGEVFAVGTPSLETGNNGFVNIYNTNPFTNLLFNGSAEILPVIGNGWIQSLGNTSGFLNPAVAQHSDHYFYANTSALSVIYQDVDLSSFESEIDSGNKAFQLSFYVRSFNQNPPDEARAVLEYKDGGDNILDSFDTGYISSINVWQYVLEAMYAPVGARSVRVTLYQNRTNGTSNDGFIDDVIFKESANIIIPDTNFEQALIDGNIDTNTVIDGQISEEDALGIITLDVSSKAITDLTGIEGFSNLQSLNISNNTIVDLDLSQNTSLISVVANDNLLESFNIQNSNNTNISTFNASNNPSLFCIQVDDVDYSNTNWSLIDSHTVFRLDCNGIPFFIPDSNFEQALIDQGIDTDGILNGQMFDLDALGIVNLDVSGQNISDLTGIESFSNLETLTVSNNNLLTLNLNTISSLISLDASNNDLQSLSVRNGNNQNISTANFIATNNPNLTCISVDNTQYSTTNWTNINSQTTFAVDCSATNPNNLLFNGSAELSPLETNGWTVVSPGFSSFQTGSGFAQDGISIFYANQSPFAEIYQEVDVSMDAVAIDAGQKTYRFSVQLRSFGFTNTDENRAVVEYLDNSGNVIETYDTGLIASVNTWLGFEDFTVAPVGTRSIKVSLSAIRTENSGNNDAYIDDVVLEEANFINIPDPNFEQVLIDLGIDSDGTINQQLLQSDAASVTSLDVSSQNISDLTGIEGFISLETLFAFNNNLNTVDLSANTALSALIISINNLTDLDVTNNTNLVSLAAGSNQISSIDLSNNTSLNQIIIDNNELSAIDVSGLGQLAQINITNNDVVELDLSSNGLINQVLCENNNLVNLNMQNGNNSNINSNFFNATGNPNLFCIQVDDVSFSDANWPNLDSQSFYGLDCAPSNDNCIEAQPLTLGDIIAGTTLSATSSASFPSCQEDTSGLIDVWYQFTAPSSGLVTAIASSALSNINVNIAINSGCNELEPISCDSGTVEVSDLIPGGTYYLQLWMYGNLGGRSAQNSVQVGDFSLELRDSVLSLEENTINDTLKVYPNPADSIVNIEANVTFDSIVLFDITGKQVLVLKGANQGKITLNLEDLSKGLYMVQLKNESSVINKKLLIK